MSGEIQALETTPFNVPASTVLDPSALQFPALSRHHLREHIEELRRSPEGAIALRSLREMGYYIADINTKDALKDPVLLLQLVELQQKAVLSLENAENNTPCSAIYFAHDINQLKEVLSVEGAQLLVIKKKGTDRIYGEYIYHVDGRMHAHEDDKLFEAVQEYFKTRMAPEHVAQLKVGVSHVVIIDPDFSDLTESLGLPRGVGYTAFQQFKAKEEEQHHIDFTIGTCRIYPAANTCAFERHGALAGFEDTNMRLTCSLPSDPSKIVISAVLIARPQSPATVDIPFENLDPDRK